MHESVEAMTALMQACNTLIGQLSPIEAYAQKVYVRCCAGRGACVYQAVYMCRETLKKTLDVLEQSAAPLWTPKTPQGL